MSMADMMTLGILAVYVGFVEDDGMEAESEMWTHGKVASFRYFPPSVTPQASHARLERTPMTAHSHKNCMSVGSY